MWRHSRHQSGGRQVCDIRSGRVFTKRTEPLPVQAPVKRIKFVAEHKGQMSEGTYSQEVNKSQD